MEQTVTEKPLQKKISPVGFYGDDMKEKNRSSNCYVCNKPNHKAYECRNKVAVAEFKAKFPEKWKRTMEYKKRYKKQNAKNDTCDYNNGSKIRSDGI